VELGISDAEMEKGTLRCDANISVRQVGEEGYRTRWELKNMNSFNYIGRGIEAAVREQIALHESGRDVIQETYDYDADRDTLTPHRTKEEAEDYRYFPEPDLVPVEPEAELIEALRAELPELPGRRIRRLENDVGFATAFDLVASGRDGLWQDVVAAGAEARATANVIMNQLAGAGVALDSVDPAELAKLIEARDQIPRAAFDEALTHAGDPGFVAEPYLGQKQVSDTETLGPAIEAVLAANPGQVAAYLGGKEGLLGFFVGQVMKETGGAANPKVVSDLLRERLTQ
jgi:aspartyl-tRNA(Asn)/glutamyl-tRNA(Gln) amidotransferase subunit B